MFNRRSLAGLTALAALAGGIAGSAPASASAQPPARGDAPPASATKNKPTAFAAAQGTRCRAWRVQGQTWFAGQDNGYTLMFTLRQPTGSTRVSGFAQYFQSYYEHAVGSQLIKGGLGTFSNGLAGIHMDIVWSNGSSGQYNAVAYDPRPTSSGGLTASLRGTTVDTSGGGGAAHWWADGLEGPLGSQSYLRPLYCAPRDVVR